MKNQEVPTITDTSSLSSQTQTQRQGLSQSIQQHLEEYFKILDGEMPPEGLYERVLCAMERPLLEVTLKATGGNQIRAAQILGLNRNTLRKKISALEIDIPARQE